MNRHVIQFLRRDERMRTPTLAFALPLLLVCTLLFFANFTFAPQYKQKMVETAVGTEVHSSRIWHPVPRRQPETPRHYDIAPD